MATPSVLQDPIQTASATLVPTTLTPTAVRQATLLPLPTASETPGVYTVTNMVCPTAHPPRQQIALATDELSNAATMKTITFGHGNQSSLLNQQYKKRSGIAPFRFELECGEMGITIVPSVWTR